MQVIVVKRIIEDVLQAEEKVEAVLRQSRQEASEILHSSETEISEKMGDAREKARGIVQTAVEDAKKRAELTRAEKLKQANQEKEDLLKSNANAIDALVDDICKIILNTEYNRDGE